MDNLIVTNPKNKNLVRAWAEGDQIIVLTASDGSKQSSQLTARSSPTARAARAPPKIFVHADSASSLSDLLGSGKGLSDSGTVSQNFL